MAIQPETCFEIPQQSVASGDAKETTNHSSPNDVAVKRLIKSSIGVIHDAVRMIRILQFLMQQLRILTIASLINISDQNEPVL